MLVIFIKNKLSLLACVIALVTLPLHAQKQQRHRGGDSRGEFNIEKIKQDQADFYKKELQLTDAEAKAFIPLLNEFTDKKFEINKVPRQQSSKLRGKTDKEDADYYRAVDAYLDAKIKEAQLQKEYYAKFKAVISADKLYRLRRVDMKFMQDALQNRKEPRQNK